MKKILAVILCCAFALSFVACSGGSSNTTEPAQTESTHNIEETLGAHVTEHLEKELADFNGIVYITHNGTLIYSQAMGKDELGADLALESPMYIGSLSKQFCAVAIMILKEQGKLSLDDTLDKYFPEYKHAKDITVKNLLTMRSGIPEMVTDIKGHSADKTESENISVIKEWIFDQPLNFEPDAKLEYSNTNYFLLGNIIEIVSGQHYNDFIRENIFKPLGMDHSGFVSEVKDNTFFSRGLTYNTFTVGEDAEGMTKGAGDIVTTAADMEKWMTGLKSGQVVSMESYNEMITDHSPDYGQHYGYGLSGMYKQGIGHLGSIGNYVAVNYINETYGYNIFAVTTESHNKINNLPVTIVDILLRN